MICVLLYNTLNVLCSQTLQSDCERKINLLNEGINTLTDVQNVSGITILRYFTVFVSCLIEYLHLRSTI